MNTHTLAFPLLMLAAGLGAMPVQAAPVAAAKVQGITAASAGAGRGQQPAVRAGRVSINTADAAALSAGLSGVGPAKAEAIVAWRKKHGAFRNLAQLLEVKGIGPALIERNKDRLSL